jgi:DNA-directed RNA polymerase subunit RPC12/RpoP
MLIDLTEGRGRGQWRRVLLDEFTVQPRWSAIICCPDCGVLLPIPNHTIAADGQVSPSVGHPVTQCSWHVHPKLIGWNLAPPLPSAYPDHECSRCGAKTKQLSGWSVSNGLVCPACFSKLFAKEG